MKRNIKSFIVGSCIGLVLFGISVACRTEQKPESLRCSEVCQVEQAKTEESETVKNEGLHPAEVEVITDLDPEEVELIGRTIWGEAEGVKSKAERAAVAWCILNRVDAYHKTVEEIVTAPNQFQGYRTEGECPQEHLDLAADVLRRYYDEKAGNQAVGRVLPEEFIYFTGDGSRNHFTTTWRSTNYWDWSYGNPYTN